MGRGVEDGCMRQWLAFAAVVLVLVVGGLFWWHQNHRSHGCKTETPTSDVVICY
jgi:fatty-acid desaturase